ncbi:BRCT domain-containing protein [Thermodesulfobacteriota bacterium]
MESESALVKRLVMYNEAYRRGEPLVSDQDYDRLVEKLRDLNPDHPFLQAVEPERLDLRKEIRHPVPMLSTEKAYTPEELQRFVNRVIKEANDIGVDSIFFKVTPKLDGLAARDDGNIFASRGNGEIGYEISSAFVKGVIPYMGRGLGLGEIVIKKAYFEKYLSNQFEHPRNMVVGIITSDKLNDFAQKALEDKAVLFMPYSALLNWVGSADDLLENIDTIREDLISRSDYPVDGVVIEVTDEEVKRYMGATAHHYRWQVAVKSKGETAITVVKGIKWQVGRTGSVTPVLAIQPVSLSGATIRRVSAHHAGLVLKNRVGIGAEIEVIRSGEVIPKLEKVIKASDQYGIPKECPSCNSVLKWDNDFLKCVNPFCRAQVEQHISHWFKTLGNADWFGIKTIQKLVDNGFDSLEKIYAMNEDDFFEIGFGPVQSKNLEDAIHTSLSKPVEDWRFLAAFGIAALGIGDSRKFLAHIRLENILSVSAEDIAKIHGFGEVTSKSIEQGIARIKDTFNHMLSLGFNLEQTPLRGESDDIQSLIAGNRIVFTGKMQGGSRDEMQAQARRLGATVQTAITGTTDYLVCGQNVGAAKIERAKKMDVQILDEAAYSDMINDE